MSQPNAIAAFSMVLLTCQGRFLLLERAASKRFAPGKWTGLGGRIESGELEDVRVSALRELAEEAGLRPDQIARFTPRRALLHARPGAPLTLLLYFTGDLREPVLPTCPEGTLHWVTAHELAHLDLIDNARAVIEALIADLARDPDGLEPLVVGAARYAPDGSLDSIVWA